IQLLFPVLVMLLMGGLLGGAIAGTTGDYIVFVVPGILAFTVLSGIETAITAVTGDAAKTVTDRFRTLPISRGSVLLDGSSLTCSLPPWNSRSSPPQDCCSAGVPKGASPMLCSPTSCCCG